MTKVAVIILHYLPDLKNNIVCHKHLFVISIGFV